MLLAMENDVRKKERGPRPKSVGRAGAAQRMDAWGIPAEAGCEEDGGEKHRARENVDATRGGHAHISGRLFVSACLLIGAGVARRLFVQCAQLLRVAQLHMRRDTPALPVVHALPHAWGELQPQRFGEGLVRPCRIDQSGGVLSIHSPILNTVFILSQANQRHRPPKIFFKRYVDLWINVVFNLVHAPRVLRRTR